MALSFCVLGAGYVGLVSAAVLAEWGHDVKVLDRDADKINCLRQGQVPFYEKGLDSYIENGFRTGRLRFSLIEEVVEERFDAVLIAVGTPSSVEGRPDLEDVWSAVGEAGKLLKEEGILALKSTVPVGTSRAIDRYLKTLGNKRVEVVCNPEFLRQGRAIEDFLRPARIVIGAIDEATRQRVSDWYVSVQAPVVATDWESAETIKYAANVFLAMKISYINWMAAFAEKTGADVADVAYGIGLDPRIGADFMQAGIGFGGSCLPKDTRALVWQGRSLGLDSTLIETVLAINEQQKSWPIIRLQELWGSIRGKKVAVLGLSFKAGTTDFRESVGLAIAEQLLREGAQVVGFDPLIQGHEVSLGSFMVPVIQDPYEAAVGQDALILTTDWAGFRGLDWRTMITSMGDPVIVDGRRVLVEEAATWPRWMDGRSVVYFTVGNGGDRST